MLSEDYWLIMTLRQVSMDPMICCTTLTSHQGLSKILVLSLEFSLMTMDYRPSHSELVDIEKVAVCSSLRPLKSKRTIDNALRVLRIILMVLPEHPSDTKVVTIKMEILLEPTSNKLLVVGFNSLVHSFCALSTLRRSGLRTASAAAKPCQGDSLEFYLITGRIPTVAAAGQRHHVGPKVTTSHGSNTSQQRMLKRFTVADDLKECSKIKQVKGTKPKSTILCTKLSMNEESKTTSLKLNSCQGSIGKSSTTNASLPPEWSKLVTDVKLVRDLHTTNFNQLNAYLEQHELHANEVRIMRERNQDPLALVANHRMTPSRFNTYQSSYNNPQFQQQTLPSRSPQYGSINPTQHYSTTYPSTPLEITYPSTPYPNAYSSTVHQDACPQPQSIPQIEYTISIVNQQTNLAQIDSGLAVLVFKQGADPIDAINKMMSFLYTVVTSRFLSTNNQLRNSSNPRQQATIHDGRVTVQPVQGRQSSFTIGKVTWQDSAQSQRGKRDATGFMAKFLLVEAQASSKVLNVEELAFLADPRVVEAKAVLLANLSSYGSDVLSEVPHSENTHNDMLNQSVQEMQYSEQTHLVNYPENEITSDSNIILYS
ncbi:hypothetical protein Tco_1187171 [Tanacetum coccineum]